MDANKALEVRRALAALGTRDDAREAFQMVRDRWNQISTTEAIKAVVKLNLVPGTVVKFQGRRTQGTLVGTVERVNSKTVGVEVPSAFGSVHWRVSPSVIQKADECELDAFRKRVKGQTTNAEQRRREAAETRAEREWEARVS